MSRKAWLSAITAVVVTLLVGLLIYVSIKPIIGFFRQREADAVAAQDHAVDDAEGRRLEAEGTATIGQADSIDRTQTIIIREAAHALELETRADSGADDRLPDSVIDRVGRGDELLCASGVECRKDRASAAPVVS